ISLHITLWVVPKSSRHADPRLAHDKLADLFAHGPTFIVDHIRGHPGQRSGKGARFDGRENIAHDDSAGDFGSTRIVNDRQAFLANLFKKPAPRFRIPRLAGGAQNAQATELMRLQRFVAIANQGPYQSRRHTENGYRM